MQPKTILLVDGANTFTASKMLGFHIDYKKLYEVLLAENDIVRANYYTAVKPNTGENDPIIRLVDWLAYNEWKVVKKLVRVYNNDEGEIMKGNMDVEISIDAIMMMHQYDHLILASGDGDFCYLVDTLQRAGKEITVLSTMATNPPMVASLLRREADHFLELREFIPLIARQREF